MQHHFLFLVLQGCLLKVLCRSREKGFQKYDANQLVEFGRQAGFENIIVKDIVKGKSFVVIYTK